MISFDVSVAQGDEVSGSSSDAGTAALVMICASYIGVWTIDERNSLTLGYRLNAK